MKALLTPKLDSLGCFFSVNEFVFYLQLTGCLPVKPDPGSVSALLHELQDSAPSGEVEQGAVARSGVWVRVGQHHHRLHVAFPAACGAGVGPHAWHSPHFQGIWRGRSPSSLLLGQESLSKQGSEVICQGDALETCDNLNSVFSELTLNPWK